MSTALEVVETFYSLFAEGDIDRALAQFDPDCITVTPGSTMTQADHRVELLALKDGFPDARLRADFTVDSPNVAAVFGVCEGTPTDRRRPKLHVPFADYFEVVDDLIVSHRTVFDRSELARHKSSENGQDDA